MPPHDAAIATAPPTPLQQALRRAARSGPGHAALRVRLGHGPAAALRLVRQLLEEASRGRGIHATGPTELLLAEAAAAAAAEARRAIETLLAGEVAAEITAWTLPADGAALLGLAGEATALPPPAPAPPASARGLESLVDAVPLSSVARRSPVLMLGAPGQVLPGPIRIGIRQDALAAALGLPAGERELLRHARDRIARRLLAALAEDMSRRDLLGEGAPRRLVVELPPDALAPDPGEADAIEPRAPDMLAALPLTLAADPALLARRRAALASHGWGLALRGVTAAALAMIAPEALEADALLLRWSPELAGRGAAAALRRLDPARLVLLGCDEEEALRWGLSLGIRQFGGAHAELILAAARMAACPARARCTRRQCLLRAAATAEAGREGCANRVLLAAVVAEEPAG